MYSLTNFMNIFNISFFSFLEIKFQWLVRTKHNIKLWNIIFVMEAVSRSEDKRIGDEGSLTKNFMVNLINYFQYGCRPWILKTKIAYLLFIHDHGTRAGL